MDRYSHRNPLNTPNIGAKKELRQSRIGSSSSSMDSSNSSFLYRKSYPNSDINGSFSSASIAGSIQDENIISSQGSLTQAELEEYSRSQIVHHQKQSSYAQSEGYHSYVSSSDSTSATPFLDRLRQESELLSRSSSQQWSPSDLQSSASANNISDNNSSGSTSSTETLKWLGSMSDVSISSHATNSSHLSGTGSASQLIAHSSRVRTPKRHNSESVLYMNDDHLSVISDSSKTSPSERSSRSNYRLFPVSTYVESTIGDSQQSPIAQPLLRSPQNHNWQSVADRINELEKQYTSQHNNAKNLRYTYLDPSKTTRVPNTTLKAFQKNAVQSYFERQQQQTMTSPPKDTVRHNNHSPGNARPQSLPLVKTTNQMQLIAQSRSSLPTKLSQMINISGQTVLEGNQEESNHFGPFDIKSPRNSMAMTPPTAYHQAVYSSIAHSEDQQAQLYHGVLDSRIMTIEQSNLQSVNESGVPPPPPRKTKPSMPVRRTSSASEYSAIRDQNIQKQTLSKDLLGPMVVGPIISLDDWVPERPPKNPMLRVPSPELPPPPPTIAVENDVNLINQDEPLPPPPPELLRHMRQLSEPEKKLNTANRRNSFAGSTSKKSANRMSGHFDNRIPPVLPKKPPTMDQSGSRPLSKVASTSTHSPMKTHKVILNGKLEGTVTAVPNRLSDTRLSLRKRSHNAPVPLHEMHQSVKANVTSPPPLKPRMSLAMTDLNNRSTTAGSRAPAVASPAAAAAPIAPGPNKTRSNSKASYLPRQSREKLTTDPDHGSYKLTLTSNEDSIPSNVFHENIHATKINNLPDVLPLGVKMKNVPPRYGSNNNLMNNSGLNNKSTILPTSMEHIPQTAPALSAYSMKNMFHFTNNSNQNNHNHQLYNNGKGTSYTTNNGDAISQRYLSQSITDLKRAQHLFGSNELHFNNNKLSPGESDGSLADSTNRLRNEFVNRGKMIDCSPVQPKIHNTTSCNSISNNVSSRLTAPSPVPSPHKDDKVIRTDSLKENIDKITQLQSQLMSGTGHERSKDLNKSATEELPVKSVETVKSARDNVVEKKVPAPVENSITSQNGDVHSIDQTNGMPPSSNTSIDEEHEVSTTQSNDVSSRLNVSEAASQTDEGSLGNLPPYCDSASTDSKSTYTALLLRTKYPEELDCEKLAEALAQQLAPTDRLHNILAPKVYKTTADYVTGLYNPHITPRSIKKDVGTSMHRDPSLDIPEEKLNGTHISKMITPPASPFARKTTRYNREMTLVNGDYSEVAKQKDELVVRLTKKIETLRNERNTIDEETTANDQLGTDIAAIVSKKIRPSEASKFRSYVDDVGHITMLLLSLSGRLARTENNLYNINDAVERKSLDTKRARLLEQLDEAKRLKTDIDRRGKVVAKILEKHLTIEEYTDYDFFINMKSKLIVDHREVTDKIDLGGEQLNALKETLAHSEC